MTVSVIMRNQRAIGAPNLAVVSKSPIWLVALSAGDRGGGRNVFDAEPQRDEDGGASGARRRSFEQRLAERTDSAIFAFSMSHLTPKQEGKFRGNAEVRLPHPSSLIDGAAKREAARLVGVSGQIVKGQIVKLRRHARKIVKCSQIVRQRRFDVLTF